ncbi:MAG: hypothetical protein G01um101470_878 [Parcubacteria group bacterium Gr01-1014_70]|nr:MAG: hypothetical protein G01um101470_878 [Parcubacteria group bacterium Gr01-1014_70]
MIHNRKLWAASMLVISFVLGLVIIRAQAASNDSSVRIEKDRFSGTFTITIKDPDGIQEFSLSLVGRYTYGGGLSSCPTTFSNDNVALVDPSDFTPVMPAYIVDCKNNKTEFEIPPPEKGVTSSKRVKKDEPPPAPLPVAQKEEKKEEKEEAKKEGPLSAKDIQHPVPELGNCQNEAECRSYCDSVDHAKECFAFAKKYNLISEEEAKKAADHFLNVKNGPGGCNSGKSCEAYCSTLAHIDECIAFAEETGYYELDELAEAKKFQALVKAGTKFPGGCTERNTCEIYCSEPNHMEECLSFAETSGIMPPEEIAEAKKFMTLMKQGESPGGCTSREQCENYCFEENHIDECIAFAEKAGVMSAEDAAMARKVGGKGPGNCRSKEQCDTYCRDHSEECFHFAEEHGLLSEDDLKHMREGTARFREELDKMPPEAVQCMKDAAGEENFNKMAAGEPVFDRSIEEKMKSCFGQITAEFSHQLDDLPPEAAQCIQEAVGEDGLQKLQSGAFDHNLNFESLEGCFQQLKASFGGGGNFSEGGFSGPGGCKNTEECIAYCKEHMDECQGFGPPGGMGGGFGGGGFDEQHESCFPKGTVASFVCARNGRDALPDVEVTYFNRCTAKELGAEIIHEGVCEGHAPCAEIADPVCGNDNQTYVNACNAKGQSIDVQYTGVCRGEQFMPHDTQTLPPQDYQQPSSGESFSGPGGCSTPEECTTYCMQHYQDPACQKFMPSDTSPMPSQDYQQEYHQEPTSDYQPSADFNSPGGCTNQEECTAYCTKNYQDPACEKFVPSSTSSSLLISPLLNALFGPLLLLFE